MIYVAADTHIPMEIRKISEYNFPEQENLTKKDYLIICGDFGGVWDNNKEERFWRYWLTKRNYTTLFVDGNHENFDLLYRYPVQIWNGGKVRFINESVIHLMRGQIFNINGNTIFTMGGAKSVDRRYRIKDKSWWDAEIPSIREIEEGIQNLERHNWKVDYVITHTGPLSLVDGQMYLLKKDDPLDAFMEVLLERLEYKHWYFGHFHKDIKIDDKHTLLYEKVELLCK